MVLQVHAGPEPSVRVYFFWQLWSPGSGASRTVGPYYAWKPKPWPLSL